MLNFNLTHSILNLLKSILLGSILARTWDQLKKLWFKLTQLADFLTRSTSRTRWWYISLVLGGFLPSLRIKRLFVRGSAKGSFCSRQIEFSQICDPNTASKNKGLKIPSISHIYIEIKLKPSPITMNIAICRSSKKSLNEFFLKAAIEKPNETILLERGMRSNHVMKWNYTKPHRTTRNHADMSLCVSHFLCIFFSHFW